MPTTAAPAASRPADLRPLLSRITRDQGPEFEQTVLFAPLTQVSTPTSLRTDRKIKWVDFHLRMRITNGGTGPTLRSGPSLLGANNSNILFSLFQQITIRGQHLKYGSQTIFQMRGEAAAEFLALVLPNYIPQYSVNANGAGLVRFGALSTTLAQTNDIDDAIRFYHAAVYGAWETDPVAAQLRARLELSQFLVRHRENTLAEAELISLAANIPDRDAELHRQAGDG